ncbi:hypothetical protein L226DRAFT_172682 [Lentinus tigrinus ALCF2SS1-7]|uniref:uncharacterized protein n=1 Tax=Lentinus tigrinus ALCF2SS1-7 TaxID=1328758 RepID=UPI00116606E9|nr:hypothetical protein L226DRAFT_172682 [Lentinus tigrinus ALCF2SS1-7]
MIGLSRKTSIEQNSIPILRTPRHLAATSLTNRHALSFLAYLPPLLLTALPRLTTTATSLVLLPAYSDPGSPVVRELTSLISTKLSRRSVFAPFRFRIVKSASLTFFWPVFHRRSAGRSDPFNGLLFGVLPLGVIVRNRPVISDWRERSLDQVLTGVLSRSFQWHNPVRRMRVPLCLH